MKAMLLQIQYSFDICLIFKLAVLKIIVFIPIWKLNFIIKIFLKIDVS